jgi:hypothetical protein
MDPLKYIYIMLKGVLRVTYRLNRPYKLIFLMKAHNQLFLLFLGPVIILFYDIGALHIYISHRAVLRRNENSNYSLFIPQIEMQILIYSNFSEP